MSPVLAGRFFTSEPPGKPKAMIPQFFLISYSKLKKKKKKKKRKVRKSDGREEGRQGEHGVDLNADRKDTALPSCVARCGHRERGKKTVG